MLEPQRLQPAKPSLEKALVSRDIGNESDDAHSNHDKEEGGRVIQLNIDSSVQGKTLSGAEQRRCDRRGQRAGGPSWAAPRSDIAVLTLVVIPTAVGPGARLGTVTTPRRVPLARTPLPPLLGLPVAPA